jgi:hypothetical protein
MTDFEKAMADVQRSVWTAMNVFGESSDWVTQDDIKHMENCPLKEKYESLYRAAASVWVEWTKIKKKLNDESLENLLKLSGAGDDER